MDKLLGIYNNPAEVIFKKLYSVRIPIIATYSEHELEIMGIPMNQIDGANKNSYNEFTTVMITINDMIEKYMGGFPIRIATEEDVLHVYNVIQRHLQHWQNYSVNSLNQVASDIDDDLVLLDKFANEIYDHNKVTVIESNRVKTPSFSSDFGKLLMGARKTEAETPIDYDSIERQTLAPEQVRHSKYDLNSLLQ